MPRDELISPSGQIHLQEVSPDLNGPVVLSLVFVEQVTQVLTS